MGGPILRTVLTAAAGALVTNLVNGLLRPRQPTVPPPTSPPPPQASPQPIPAPTPSTQIDPLRFLLPPTTIPDAGTAGFPTTLFGQDFPNQTVGTPPLTYPNPLQPVQPLPLQASPQPFQIQIQPPPSQMQPTPGASDASSRLGEYLKDLITGELSSLKPPAQKNESGQPANSWPAAQSALQQAIAQFGSGLHEARGRALRQIRRRT